MLETVLLFAAFVAFLAAAIGYLAGWVRAPFCVALGLTLWVASALLPQIGGPR